MPAVPAGLGESERRRRSKEGRKEGRRSRSSSLEVRAETPAPSAGPGGSPRSFVSAQRPRPCSAVGRQEPRHPATPGYPLGGQAGIEIKASRIKRSPPARPPLHLQLASGRTPIYPPTLTWSWRPAPAWREDPRPARGEGWAGAKDESHAKPEKARGGRSSSKWGEHSLIISCPLVRSPSCLSGGGAPMVTGDYSWDPNHIGSPKAQWGGHRGRWGTLPP